MYREQRIVARVRVHDIKVDNWGVTAKVTVIPTPGCSAPQDDWEISSAWEAFSHNQAKEAWFAKYIGWRVYFKDDLLRDVIRLSQDPTLDEANRSEKIRDRVKKAEWER